jgi:hypothetical protein
MAVILHTLKESTDPELEETILLLEREIGFLRNLAYASSNPQIYERIRSTIREQILQRKQLLAEREQRIRQGYFRPF